LVNALIFELELDAFQMTAKLAVSGH